MDLRQLRYLQEIVRHKHFGRAADALGITQPALSKSMRLFEEELGVSLLERAPGGVVPTPYGALLVEHACVVTTELDRAVAEIHALAGTSGGTVRVGGTTTVLRLMLPEALDRLAREHPGIDVSVMEGLRDDNLAWLRSGQIDVALALAFEDPQADEFRVEKLISDRVSLVARAEHPLLGRGTLALADCAAYRWVLPNRRERERQALFRAFARAGLEQPKVAVQTSSSVLMAALIARQDHLSYLPEAALTLDPVFAGLRKLPLPPLPRPTDAYLVTRRRGAILPAVRAFLAVMRAVGADYEAGKPKDGADSLPGAE